ncbi:MAG TPA: alpha-ketoacid dehydrogenase subunit beta [Acidimicrobiia bacterium]|nr:alpha-ketoacid dehydrogenase subunit beta [Acidimicrobiia bacterium]
MAVLTLAQAVTDALDTALDQDDRVLLMGEDVGKTGGVFRVSNGLYEKYGPARIIDAPVAESGIIGTAFGMAVAGMRPVTEIQFMGFSYPAYDQIVSHVGRIRNRSRHRFTAPMVIRMPYGGGIGAAEHHSESTESIYAHTPGVKVVVPSTPYDAKGMLLQAIDDPDPVIFLEPIRLYRSVKEEIPDGPYRVPLGLARVLVPGEDVTVITYGAMTVEGRKAVAILAQEGVSAELIDLRSIVPFDVDTVVGSVEKTGRAVVVHEAHRTAGFGAEVVAQIQERALFSLTAPVQRVTGWDMVVPLKLAEHHYVPTADRIVAAVGKTLED